MIKMCAICANEFEPYNTQSKYCSVKCAMISDKTNYYITINKMDPTDAIFKAINQINLKYYSNPMNKITDLKQHIIKSYEVYLPEELKDETTLNNFSDYMLKQLTAIMIANQWIRWVNMEYLIDANVFDIAVLDQYFQEFIKSYSNTHNNY